MRWISQLMMSVTCSIRCKLYVSNPAVCQLYNSQNSPGPGNVSGILDDLWCLVSGVDRWQSWWAFDNRILTGNADFSSVVLPWLSMKERKSLVYCEHFSFVCNVILTNCNLIILWKDVFEFWENVSSVYEADWEVTASVLSI